ncbi:TraR/DksA family transcriptional regulator [Schlegelella aquatica]|uniref:TraR/DksA family transcriptional regulator n=1 Tax=Caldimonas aquatica TaxID=376175 RepID=UPI0037532617
MTSAGADLLRERLQKRLDELRAEVRAASLRDASEAEAVVREAHDRGDEASAEIQLGIGDAELVRDLHELREVEAALQRMARGTYGQCEDCGQEIGEARLAAHPAARRCAACQAAQERRRPR